jgi:hypothetical protein
MSYKVFLIWIMILILGLTGCSQISSTSLSNELDFLKRYELDVKENPTIIKVKVPSDWQVQLGEYPVGLYWGLANEYSKDVGLDLTILKGKSVEAHIYELKDGLPGSGEQAKFSYPSNAILIVENRQVVGAWLTFNTQSIGPSVKKRTLSEITGFSFEEWIKREHYFETSGTNTDLASLGPTQVIDTFFDSINKGDKVRAHACLSPKSLLESLTMNLEPGHLYNVGFSQNNSLVENIVKGKPIEYRRLFDPENHEVEIKELGDRTKIEIEVNLEIEWRHPAFNTQDGKSIRFAVLGKYNNGWKLSELGTGP